MSDQDNTFSADQGTASPDQGTPGFGNQGEAGSNQATTDTTNTDQSVVEIGGRTYTKEDVEKKIAHADQHIEKLEGEQATYRQDMDNLLNKMDEISNHNSRLQSALEDRFYNQNSDSSQQEIDPEALVSRAKEETRSELQQERQQEEQQKNIQTVSNRLQELFGDNPDEEVFKRANEVGYSKEEAFQLAATKPQAFYRLIGVEEGSSSKKKDVQPVQSDLNTAGQQSQKENSMPSMLTENTTKGKVDAFNQRLEAKKKELGLT